MSNALYDLIAADLARGEGATLVDVARSLVQLERGSERSTVALAVCLTRAGAVDEAERVLLGYPDKTAAVATNLARVSAARGDEGGALKELAGALELDVNYEPALLWWASLVKQKLDDAAYAAALASLAKKPGAWRVHLIAFGHSVAKGNITGAKQALAAALSSCGPKPGPASEIALLLAHADAHAILVELFADYEPAMHGFVTGEKLVAAHVALGNTELAKAVLDLMRAHEKFDEREIAAAAAHLSPS